MSRVISALAFLFIVPVQSAKSGCVDYAPDAGGEWHNAIGASYGCSWYSLLDNCKTFGGMHPNFNRTAKQACCVCQPAADAGEPGPRPSGLNEPSSAEGAVMIVQALAFTSSGSREEVATALRGVLLDIHGASQENLRLEVAKSGARRLTGSWSVEYDVVASGQVADWHEAIAMKMNVGRAQTSLLLASRFAGVGLAFDDRTLAVGLPERREAMEPSTAGAGDASTPATAASASLTATTTTTTTTAEAWSSARSTTGATTTRCLDFVPDGQQFWHDMLGPTYSCEWYELGRCTFADAYEMFGRTASQACCACGGGAHWGEATTTTVAQSEGAFGGDDGGSEDQPLIFGFQGNEFFIAITFVFTVLGGVCTLTIMGYIKVKYFPAEPSTEVEDPHAPAASEPDLFESHSHKTMLDVLQKLDNHPAAQTGSRGRASSTEQTAWWHSEGAMGGAARGGGGGGGGASNRVNKWHSEGSAGRGIPTVDQIIAPGGPYYASENSNARSNVSAGTAARAPRASTGSSDNSRRPLAPTSRF